MPPYFFGPSFCRQRCPILGNVSKHGCLLFYEFGPYTSVSFSRNCPQGGGGYLGMCRWPLRAPPPSIKVYYVANYRPHLIIVTFEQICNFRDPNLFTFYFDELTHFLDWMKNTLLFICSRNILVRLLTEKMKNRLTPKNPKMCDPTRVTLLKCDPIIVNPVVKMRPHSAAHPH